MKRIDITNQKFGRLIVKEFSYIKGTHSYWKCLCMCGNYKIIRNTSLNSGVSQSCGCLRSEIQSKFMRENHIAIKHNMSNTPTYNVWQHMKSRCCNPKDKFYYRYGGRGIRVCERWHIFENFFADMGERTSSNHSIDRINNDGNYEPNNCRWATIDEQVNNTSRSRYIIINDELHTLTQWCKIMKINQSCVVSRLKNNWAIDKAILTPPYQNGDGRFKKGMIPWNKKT